MAVAALRVALGQLPSGSVPALAAALRPSTPRSTWILTEPPANTAATALRVAAGWLAPGTPAAAALAAVSGRTWHEICANVAERENTQSSQAPDTITIAAALAVAACQQTSLPLAAAAGRAYLNANGSPKRKQNTARNALAVAAGILSREAAAPLVALSRSRSQQLRRYAGGSHKSFTSSSKLPPNHHGERSQCESSLLPLCKDTSRYVIMQLWPPNPNGLGGNGHSELRLSPRTFEARLLESRPLLNDLSRVSAVSPAWNRQADQDGWPSTHAYLYQEPGTKLQLQQRYEKSMRQLQVRSWFQHSFFHAQGASSASVQPTIVDTVMNNIIAFMH